MTAPHRRWPEDDIDTLVNMPLPAWPGKVEEEPRTPPAPVKRRTMEQDPRPARPPTREEVEEIEDQILKMAFDKAMRTTKRKTLIMVFLIGFGTGFVAFGIVMAILILKAGA